MLGAPPEQLRLFEPGPCAVRSDIFITLTEGCEPLNDFKLMRQNRSADSGRPEVLRTTNTALECKTTTISEQQNRSLTAELDRASTGGAILSFQLLIQRIYS